jgi:hypothetical protein
MDMYKEDKNFLTQFTDNSASKLKELADKCGLHSEKADLLLSSLSLRPDSQRRMAGFQRLIRKDLNKWLEQGIPIQASNPEADLSGDVLVGDEILTGRKIGIKTQEFLKQGTIYAATGFYKSITIMNMAAQLIRSGISVIIIDEKGRQFRGLQRAFPNKALVMKTDGQYPFNPFSVPGGCQSSAYLPGIVEIRAVVFERHDSSNLFQEILLRECRKFPDGLAPCEADLHNSNITVRFRKGFYDYHAQRFRLSLATVSTGLVSSSFGRSLAFRRDLDMAEVLEKGLSLVIEAPNLLPKQLEYLATTLMHKVNAVLRSKLIEQDVLRLVIFIDEGSEPFRDRRELPPIIDHATKMRQAGCGLVVGLHAPHLAHSMLRTTSYFAICYRIASNESIRVVKDSMFLSAEQAAYIPTQPVRAGLITLGDRHPAPIAFMASEPLLPLDLNIPDEEIEQRNQAILKTLTPVVRWQGQLLTLTEQQESPPEESDNTDGNRDKSITSDELKLLDYWLTAFDSTATQVYAALNWSMQKGDKIVNSVVKKGLAVAVSLNPTGKRGRSIFLWHSQRFFEITHREKPAAGTDANQGPEHATLIRFIHKKLRGEKGCSSVEIGKPFEAARCDVYFRYADAGYCVEVCCSTLKTEAEKIAKILKNPDVKSVFVVANKIELVKALKDELKGLEHVVPLKFSEFLNTGIAELAAKTQGGGE